MLYKNNDSVITAIEIVCGFASIGVELKKRVSSSNFYKSMLYFFNVKYSYVKLILFLFRVNRRFRVTLSMSKATSRKASRRRYIPCTLTTEYASGHLRRTLTIIECYHAITGCAVCVLTGIA